LVEVCEFKPPKSEARKRLDDNAPVSFAPMEDLGINRKFLTATQVRSLSSVAGSYTYFTEGDVLLAKITPCFENGKLGIAAGLTNGVGFGSSEFMVLRPGANLDREYLYYYLARAAFREEGALRMGGAVGQQRVPREFVETYPIPLPPLPEQHRIVAILDQAFEAIATARANTEQNLQNARELFDSHLASVFTQRGPGWTAKPLGSICRFSNGLWKGEKPPFQRVGVIRNTNFTKRGTLNNSDVAYLDVEAKKLATRRLQFGDIILEKSGGGPKQAVGRVALFDKEDDGFSFSNFTAALRVVSPNELDFRFLHRFLHWIYLSGATEQMQSHSTGIRNLDGDAYKAIAVSFPSLPEQRRIVDRIAATEAETDRLESLYQQKLTALDNLRESILHHAFTGQL